MITITLNQIRAHSPCEEGWRILLTHLGKTQADDEPFPLSVVLDSNGLDDALWCLRCLGPEHHGWIRLYAVWCTRQVRDLMTGPPVVAALDVAERYAKGQATDAELAVAGEVVWAAKWDAVWAATAVAWAAAWAERDAQAAKLREMLNESGSKPA